MQVLIDGSQLTIADVVRIARSHDVNVRLTEAARTNVQTARSAVERWIAEGRVIYGLTTGFGEFANVVIPADKAAELQVNLIRSHSAGVGDLLPETIVRAMMVLRANALAGGRSGIRLETLETLLGMLNANLVPDIPSQGSVGSSGDLAPLSHLALALIGEGTCSGTSSAVCMREHGLQPVVLAAKEGLALINGTQMMSAIGCLAVDRVQYLCRAADVIGALSADALRGTDNAFDARLHAARPHPGQQIVARNLRTLLAGSEIRESHRVGDNRVQDAYSLRCMPQVHGASRDATAYVADVLSREINSVTDNPLVFADDDVAIEGGNFHGQPLALALDFLAIAASELANISERRTERLVNHMLGGLPRFLTPNGGLHSGMMIAQYTAASLVSENKVLAHPASVDSIPTSANQEDHNSMGSIAARKLLQVVTNAERVLSIELLCAAQGIDLLRPLRTSSALQAVHEQVRNVVPYAEHDRVLHTDIEAVYQLLSRQQLTLEVE
ncbi:MAG: histidine ammonia-lyase [Bradyrhizobiaceae bacterium]|nr:histidine ammonia-lyase [Bradyrhizobiaceae bacterium]